MGDWRNGSVFVLHAKGDSSILSSPTNVSVVELVYTLGLSLSAFGLWVRVPPDIQNQLILKRSLKYCN